MLKQFITWELENNQQTDEYFGSELSKKTESEVPIEQKVSENIQGMLDENWLVLSEGIYLTKVSMRQGELIVNDKAIDPMQQIMSTMGGGAAVQ